MSERITDIGQSEKSKSGTDFNKISAEKLIELSKNLNNFYYVGAEIKIRATRYKEFISTAEFKLDHFSFLVSDIHKQVLLMFDDNTKTYRDRIHGKAHNGSRMRKLKREIKAYFLKKYPQYSAYNIIYNCFVIFPDLLIGKYKNPDKEQLAIDNGCVDINYGTGTASSDNNFWLLDGAFRSSQLHICLKILNDKINNGEKLSRTIMRDIWKQTFNSYNLRPAIWLSKKNMIKDISYATYCLTHKSSSYSKKDIINALDAFKINYPKNTSKTVGVELLIKYLNNKNQGH